MNTTHRQTGQSIISFIIGLLLATIVIAGVVFYLNKSKSDFKTPTNTTPPETVKSEILTPVPTESTVTEPTENQSDLPQIASDVPESIDNANINTIPNDVGHHSVTSSPNTQKNTHSHTPTVTPEQILNSGSLEKAQQANKTPTNKVIVQIGSFTRQTDAEAQRAKLVMLGIESHVHSVKINGLMKYRVQTDSIDHNQANHIKETLSQHNIDSLIRTAS